MRQRATIGGRAAVLGGSRSVRGFTMVELLIVLMLLALLTGLTLPKVNFRQYQIDAAVRDISSAMQLAGRLAVVRQHDVIISFDLARNMMRTVEDANNNGGADANERIQWYPLEDQARFATPPVTVYGATPTGAVMGSNLKMVDGMPSVVFRRSGAASSNAEVYVTTLEGRANDFRAVVLIQSTGRADWMKYINGVWKDT